MPTRVLIICTGNSCRSQMAEGFMRRYAPGVEVYSAGTVPAERTHPKAIQVMEEIGIDISRSVPKSVGQFLGLEFDYVITVCDDARESCPVFTGRVRHRLHIGFEDPARIQGTEEHVLNEYRRIRDEIGRAFKAFAESMENRT